MAASYRIRRSGSFCSSGRLVAFLASLSWFACRPNGFGRHFLLFRQDCFLTIEYSFWQNTRKGVTQSYRACKMAASCRIRRSGRFVDPFRKKYIFLSVYFCCFCVLSKMSWTAHFLYRRDRFCGSSHGLCWAPRWERDAVMVLLCGSVKCSESADERELLHPPCGSSP